MRNKKCAIQFLVHRIKSWCADNIGQAMLKQEDIASFDFV